MLLTTTSTIEGRAIQEYKGIVFGEVVAGVDALKDMAAGFTNFFGGRSGSYEEALHIISEYVDTELSIHTPPPKSHQKKKGRSAYER